MYTLHRLITIALLMVSPVRLAAVMPLTIPVVEAQASTQTVPLTFDTKSTKAVSANIKTVPDFDSEVAAPLKAAQAEAKAKAIRARQAATIAAQKAVQAPVAVTGDLLYKLRLCEAGGIYTRNTGNGYYGAYQYNLGTWANYGGFARPDLAPAEVQDAKAQADIARRGFNPWPACARKIGAM